MAARARHSTALPRGCVDSTVSLASSAPCGSLVLLLLRLALDASRAALCSEAIELAVRSCASSASSAAVDLKAAVHAVETAQANPTQARGADARDGSSAHDWRKSSVAFDHFQASRSTSNDALLAVLGSHWSSRSKSSAAALLDLLFERQFSAPCVTRTCEPDRGVRVLCGAQKTATASGACDAMTGRGGMSA